MFGLTKLQLLKRSKKALQETGIQVLTFRSLKNRIVKGEITTLYEAQRSLDNLRNDAENTFSWYEKLNPPSECLELQQRIMKALIILHESVVTYSESLMAEDADLHKKLQKRSDDELDKYKELSISLSREVDTGLQKK